MLTHFLWEIDDEITLPDNRVVKTYVCEPESKDNNLIIQQYTFDKAGKGGLYAVFNVKLKHITPLF